MVIVSDVMPTLKSFLKPVRLSDAARLMVVRLVTAFILHSGRVRQAAEHVELKYISDRLQTPGGVRKLKRTLRESLPDEYRVKL